MSLGKRRVVCVNQTVMPGPNNVPDLVGDGERVGGAGVVSDEKGFLLVRADARRETASTRTVDDQTDNVGTFLVA